MRRRTIHKGQVLEEACFPVDVKGGLFVPRLVLVCRHGESVLHLAVTSVPLLTAAVALGILVAPLPPALAALSGVPAPGVRIAAKRGMGLRIVLLGLNPSLIAPALMPNDLPSSSAQCATCGHSSSGRPSRKQRMREAAVLEPSWWRRSQRGGGRTGCRPRLLARGLRSPA